MVLFVQLAQILPDERVFCRAAPSGTPVAERHLQTKHQIDWDSATCITYSKDYYQRLTLGSWFTNLRQTPLNRSQQSDRHRTNDLLTKSSKTYYERTTGQLTI